MKYAIVPYPIPELLIKGGLIAQKQETARTNNSKTQCIVSYKPAYKNSLSKYPNFDTIDSLNMFLDKNNHEWDAETKITKKYDIEGRQVIASAPFSETGGFFFTGTGFSGVAIKSDDGVTVKISNIDHILTEDRYINGIRLIVKNHSFEDNIYFEIIDKDFIFAGKYYPATPYEYGIPVPEETPWAAIMPNGMILNRFGENWQLSEESDQGREILKYPAALKAGMTIRFVFKTYSTQDVKVKGNIYLHNKKTKL